MAAQDHILTPYHRAEVWSRIEMQTYHAHKAAQKQDRGALLAALQPLENLLRKLSDDVAARATLGESPDVPATH